MGESAQHINLILKALSVAKEIAPERFSNMIIIDIPEKNEKPPQMLEGFRPDLYYSYNGILIIGEAKTSNDFERKHSKDQYLSYLRKCSCYSGTAYLIIAVPWTEYIAAKNLLRRMKKEYYFNVKVKIVNDLGRVETI